MTTAIRQNLIINWVVNPISDAVKGQFNTRYCTDGYPSISQDTSCSLGLITLVAGFCCFGEALVPLCYDLVTYAPVIRGSPLKTATFVASGTIITSIGVGLLKFSDQGCSS